MAYTLSVYAIFFNWSIQLENQRNYTRSIFILLLIIVLTGFLGILKVTQSVSMPIMLSFLMSFVFYPVLRKMHKLRIPWFKGSIHIPWVVGILIILITTFIFMVLAGNLIKSSLVAIINAYPKYESRFQTVYQIVVDKLNLPYDEESSLMTNLMNSVNVRGYLQNIAVSLSSNVISFSKIFMMVFLFFIFLLMELKNISKKLHLAFPNTESRSRITRITSHIITDVTHYISIKFLISLLTGFLVFCSTAVIKMDFAIIWGFIAFLLNFIPSFGSIVSWGVTTAFAILQFFPHWGMAIYVGTIVLLINFTLGNIVEPRWAGSDLGLSPFVILVSLSIWGYIWGFVGMLLSVPLMVSIKLICENIPSLYPVAALLGNGKQKKAKVKKSIKNLNLKSDTNKTEAELNS